MAPPNRCHDSTPGPCGSVVVAATACSAPSCFGAGSFRSEMTTVPAMKSCSARRRSLNNIVITSLQNQITPILVAQTVQEGSWPREYALKDHVRHARPTPIGSASSRRTISTLTMACSWWRYARRRGQVRRPSLSQSYSPAPGRTSARIRKMRASVRFDRGTL